MTSIKTLSIVFLLFSVILFNGCKSSSTKSENTIQEQSLYKGSPVIDAKLTSIEYRIANKWYQNRWTISPQIKHDTLKVVCYNSKVSFEFKTDIDSIEFELPANSSKDFYVKLDENTYAHTIIQGVSFKPNQITFEDDNKDNSEISIKYPDKPNDYLEELKKEFPLNFINDEMTDTEVALAVLNWTSNSWKHNGNNSPSKNDAITILNEAKAGQEFPCFAYAIVLRDQLSALGYKARTIYLKTEDAQHRKSSPGHVATEVYLSDLQKWVFIDGQFNVMPTLNGVPLNAVEFQNAISNNYDEFKLQSLSNEKVSKRDYVSFVYDYLFYFDTTLDNRYDEDKKYLVNGKRSIMLVPLGAKNITHIDFWNLDINYCIYTNSFRHFYTKPQ